MRASYAQKIAEVRPPFARARGHCAEGEGTLSGPGMIAASHAELESFANEAGQYFCDLFDRLAIRWPAKRIGELMPRVWLAQREAAQQPAP